MKSKMNRWVQIICELNVLLPKKCFIIPCWERLNAYVRSLSSLTLEYQLSLEILFKNGGLSPIYIGASSLNNIFLGMSFQKKKNNPSQPTRPLTHNVSLQLSQGKSDFIITDHF